MLDHHPRWLAKIGFIYQGGKWSHSAFKLKGKPIKLNFQNRNGFILPYQARQLVVMLNSTVNNHDKYPIEIFWSDEVEGYIALAPDLPGCNA
jgi:hypothetical protein